MDIRKYFSAVSQKKKADDGGCGGKSEKRKKIIESDEEDPLPSKNKSSRIVNSDSDDEIFASKSSKKKAVKTGSDRPRSVEKPKRVSESRNSSNSTKSKKASPKEKLESVSATDFFGTTRVATQAKRTLIKSKKSEDLQSDGKFEETLRQLDKSKSSHAMGNDSPFRKSGLASKLSEKMKKEKTEDLSPRRTSPRKRMDSESSESVNKKIKVEVQTAKEEEIKTKVKSETSKDKTPKKLKGRDRDSNDVVPEKANDSESVLKKKGNKETTPRKVKEISPKKEKGAAEHNEGDRVNGNHTSPKETKNKKKYISPNKEKTVDIPERSPKPKKGDEGKQNHLSGLNGNVTAKRKIDQNDEDVIPGTPDFDEQKKQRTLAFRKFLQRSGPRNPGGKLLPEGTPDCLSRLTFVLTGVLETIDREETSDLIKKHGGRVTTSVSKNTSFLIVGDEPGESKIKKAKQIGTKTLNEDELFDLISKSQISQKSKQEDPTESKETTEKSPKSTHKDGLSKLSSPVIRKADSPMSNSSSLSSTSSQSSLQSSQRTESISSQDLASRPEHTLMWVDKYKPATLKSIIGQQGDQSNAKKLLNWLKNWASNQSGSKKLVRPSPWAKDNTGAYFKAALLSGPPGVGKTTTATLVCKELGVDTVEFNASDTRSKKKLTEEVAELLRNKSLSGFATGIGTAVSRRHVLIMDEVDGMAGNEDRGGVQELIQLVKSSKVPVVCMCNDRNNPKIRSLANYCFDLRFQKPRIEQIRSAMLSICYREGIKIKPESVDEMIVGSNRDIRQVLHHLSVWSSDQKTLDHEAVKRDAKMAHKEFKIGPWDVVTKVFSELAHKDMSIHDKVSLFFHDYSIGPLFVQENYLKVSPLCASGNRKKLLEQISKTASVLADSDIVEHAIRKESAWSLLPSQAILSSVCPGKYMAGHFSGQVEFPRWLGNNSRRNKFDRLSQEIQTHTRLRVSGSKLDIIMDYATPLKNSIVTPLSSKGSEGVPAAVEAMASYDLLREDLESLIELTSWPGVKDPMSNVESKVKAAFTRLLNKEGHLTPFSSAAVVSKKSLKQTDNDCDEDADEHDESEVGEEDISKNSMIKMGKHKQKKSCSNGNQTMSKNKGSNTKQNKKKSK